MDATRTRLSRLTNVAMATTWSASVACRIPRKKPRARARAARGCVVAWLLACVLSAGEASAHTVGISQSAFTLARDGVLRALVVFSKTDALKLGHMDRDGDGVVSPAELASSEAVLREEM